MTLVFEDSGKIIVKTGTMFISWSKIHLALMAIFFLFGIPLLIIYSPQKFVWLAILYIFVIWGAITEVIVKVELGHEKNEWVIKRPKIFLVFLVGYETVRVGSRIKEIRCEPAFGGGFMYDLVWPILVFENGQHIKLRSDSGWHNSQWYMSVSKEELETLGKTLNAKTKWYK